MRRAPQLSARCVADVLWSLATLGELPARMLMPVLTSVAANLENFRRRADARVARLLFKTPAGFLKRENAFTKSPNTKWFTNLRPWTDLVNGF